MAGLPSSEDRPKAGILAGIVARIGKIKELLHLLTESEKITDRIRKQSAEVRDLEQHFAKIERDLRESLGVGTSDTSRSAPETDRSIEGERPNHWQSR